MAFKLPWGSNPVRSDKSTNQSDVSINDILPTISSRVELVLLVVLCTDAMKASLASAFEIQKQQASSPSDTVGDAFPLITDEDEKSSRPAIGSPRRSDTNYIRNFVLSSAGFQDLNTAATTYFNEWRTSVLRRLGESLKVQPEAVRRAKAKRAADEETKTKAQQHQDYLDWAEGKEASASNEVDTTSNAQQIAPNIAILRTNLNDLDQKTRALILNAVLFILLSLEQYPAHSRILLVHLTHSLDLPNDILLSAEANLALTLQQSASTADNTQGTAAGPSEPQSELQPRKSVNQRWKIGLATVAGAALIGVTGGLAAPFLLGAAGAIMGGVGLGGLATLLGATIANPVTVAAIFGVLGGKMGGKAMKEFSKEVEDFEILPITEDSDALGGDPLEEPKASMSTKNREQTSPQTHMRVALGISGHLLSSTDVVRPWHIFSSSAYDSFALRYELNALLQLGESMTGVLRDSAYTLAQASALQVALPALSSALLPVSLLKLGSFLDNPFSIAMERSDKAGVVLAKALIAKVQGERPITLVGYSMGSRVVHSCLLELLRQKAFGLIESAVLIGSPVPSDQSIWIKMRAVVAPNGRLINVYTSDDMLLAYLYRVRYAQIGVAGLEAVKEIKGVENFDATGLVKGHGQYRLGVGRILKEMEFDGLNLEQVGIEIDALQTEDQEERKVYEEAKQEGILRGQEDEGGKIVMVDAEGESGIQVKQERNVRASEPDHKPFNEAATQHKAERMSTELSPLHPTNDNRHSDDEPFNGSHHKQTADLKDNVDDDDDEEPEPTSGIQMISLDPTPEPHSEPGIEVKGRNAPVAPSSSNRRGSSLTLASARFTATRSPETIRFGSPQRGFDVSWHGET